MGNTLGFILSAVIYLVVVSGLQEQELSNQIYLFMLLPTLIAYPVTIGGMGVWEAIYYKLFEWGNNSFYLQSLAELSKKRQEELEQEAKNQEEVNVETK